MLQQYSGGHPAYPIQKSKVVQYNYDSESEWRLGDEMKAHDASQLAHSISTQLTSRPLGSSGNPRDIAEKALAASSANDFDKAAGHHKEAALAHSSYQKYRDKRAVGDPHNIAAKAHLLAASLHEVLHK